MDSNNNKVTRYYPTLGRSDVNPYAMMMPNPNGGWVEYNDYLKLLKEYNKLCEKLYSL